MAPMFLTPRQTEVLAFLQAGPRPAAELAGALGVTRQAVKKHLGALEAAGLVAPIGNRYAKSAKWQASQTKDSGA